MPACVRGIIARLQKQSPRRPTCTTSALRFAAFVAATSFVISTSLKMPSPNASTQNARNSLCAARACGVAG